jgi:hypothetical protein
VREESHLDDMRAAIRGDFERLEERRGAQELMRVHEEAHADVPEPDEALPEPVPEAQPPPLGEPPPAPKTRAEPPSVSPPQTAPSPEPQSESELGHETWDSRTEIAPEPAAATEPQPAAPAAENDTPPPAEAEAAAQAAESAPEPGRKSWLDRLLGRP